MRQVVAMAVAQLVLTATLSVHGAQVAASTTHWDLSWDAPEVCGGEGDFRARVDAQLEQRGVVPEFARVSLDIRERDPRAPGAASGSRFQLAITIDTHSGSGHRYLEADSCEALQAAAATVVSMSLVPAVLLKVEDSTPVARAPLEEPARHAPEAAPNDDHAAPLPTSPAKDPPSNPLPPLRLPASSRWHAEGGMHLLFGSLPKRAPQATAGGALRWSSWTVGPEVGVAALQTRGSEAPTPAATWLRLALNLRVRHTWEIAERTELHAVGTLGAYWLRGSHPGAATTTNLGVGAALGPALSWEFVDGWAGEASGTVGAGLRRAEIRGPLSLTLWREPAITGAAGLRLIVQL